MNTDEKKQMISDICASPCLPATMPNKLAGKHYPAGKPAGRRRRTRDDGRDIPHISMWGMEDTTGGNL